MRRLGLFSGYYVSSVEFNDKKLDSFMISHSDINGGGELVFTMSNKAA